MKYMTGNELREAYLKFFEEKKGHLRLPSFSLIPENDPSLLLIGAGMAPLKPFFTGKMKPPRTRITTSQRCVRTLAARRVIRRILKCSAIFRSAIISRQRLFLGRGNF